MTELKAITLNRMTTFVKFMIYVGLLLGTGREVVINV